MKQPICGDIKSFIKEKNSNIIIDFSQNDNYTKPGKDFLKAISIYKEMFLQKALPDIGHGNEIQRGLQRMGIQEMLGDKIVAKKSGKPVRDFAKNELVTYNKQLAIVNVFSRNVQSARSGGVSPVSLIMSSAVSALHLR